MKKTILTFILSISLSLAAVAQISWSIIPPSNFIYMPGVTYSAGLCQGVTGDDPVLRSIPGDPFSYIICVPYEGKGYLYNCSEGLAFNPSTHSCDYISNVAPFYPEFPWGDYGY